MARRFLIDGYNLLYAIGLPARRETGHLQLARDRLLTLIAERLPRDQVTVVFDAHQAPPGVPREQTHDGIHVIFAHGAADDLIREIVDHDSSPRTLSVVTSDHDVQRSARRREAHVIESVDFLDELFRPAPPPAANRPEKPTTASAADNQHWLEAFQMIDAEPDVRRLQHIDPMNPDPGKTKKHRSRPKKNDGA
jgi:predicted RNA-binding protein with PIN domain